MSQGSSLCRELEEKEVHPIKDKTETADIQRAHNYRDPETGVPKARVRRERLFNFAFGVMGGINEYFFKDGGARGEAEGRELFPQYQGEDPASSAPRSSLMTATTNVMTRSTSLPQKEH